MEAVSCFDPIKEMNEVRNQLSLSKKVGFFFGAGTSMALGMPGIEKLTTDVIGKVSGKCSAHLERIVEDLTKADEKTPTIEDILNHVRLIRQITMEDEKKHYNEIDGCSARVLDKEICNHIYDILSGKEDEIAVETNKTFLTTQKFFVWLSLIGRDSVKEIFTSNYDLIFEKALEMIQLPYFDGFVGAYEPFFLAESVGKIDLKEYPPVSWIRLWKVHGSLGWFWKKSNNKHEYRVIRLGKQAKSDTQDELVIYPSKEKYESSRKQPFTTYFDRMSNYLREGEGIFIISGYSFGDYHINEIVYNALRYNNRLHVVVFLYSSTGCEHIIDRAKQYLNMSVFTPTEAVIGGTQGIWRLGTNDGQTIKLFWDEDKNELILGQFSCLVDFLADMSGQNASINKELKAKNEK